jgi:hypothetical protein
MLGNRSRAAPKIGALSVAALIANIALATVPTEAKAQAYYACPPGYYFSPAYGCIANPPPQAYYYVPAPPPPPVVVSPAPLFDLGLFFGFGGHDRHEDRHWHGDRD